MDISHLLPDTVSKAPQTGLDDNGAPNYGAVTTIDARVEGQKTLKTDNDSQRRDDVTAFMTDEPMDKSDVIWLPGENTADPTDGHRIDNIQKAEPVGGGPELNIVEVK